MDAPLSKQPFFQIQGTKGEIVLEGSFDGGLKLVTVEHPVCLSVCLSVRLSVCPSVRLSVCPSVCVSIYSVRL
jgi:hypothetical protein